jgi:hypothetical protein
MAGSCKHIDRPTKRCPFCGCGPKKDQNAARDKTSLAERVYTADDVRIIVAWFGGDAARWIAHVDADARDVVNVGAPPWGIIEA